MKGDFVPLALGVAIAILLSFLPIYPLWVEGRQFTQTVESLYHEWQFASMQAYFEYAQYARTAWSEATQIVYILLAIANLIVICFLSWLVVRVLRRRMTR